MVEALLKLVIGIVGLLAFNIIYVNTTYKRKANLKNVSILTSLSILIIAFVWAFWKVIDSLSSIKFVGTVINSIDKWYGNFSTKVPFGFLIVWIPVPLLLVFIVYLILGIKKKRSIKTDYKKWKSEEEEKNKPATTENLDSNESKKNQNVSENNDDQVAETDTKPEIQNNKKNEADKKSDDSASEEIFDIQPNVEKIDYVSYDGLKKVFTDAKKQLQISKYKKDAYVAVYANTAGLNELKKIFSENSIDTSSLSKKASVVYFTASKVQTMSLMGQIEKAKAKHKED